tara:strand:+ start:1558 stop:1827 length:270 start_codon:yes stop_codon:yes gene_type:complete
MKSGYFVDKITQQKVEDSVLEDELPEAFLSVEMKDRLYPKLAYITLLGKIACAETLYVDRFILDKILDGNELHCHAIDFLCERYTFRTN